jgi:cell division protein FtsB
MKSLKLIKNRYFYSSLTLLVILFIIEDTTIFKLFHMKNELQDIRVQNIKKVKEIEQVKLKTVQLTTNNMALEKFAREHYLMKKKNEVIYVFK